MVFAGGLVAWWLGDSLRCLRFVPGSWQFPLFSGRRIVELFALPGKPSVCVSPTAFKASSSSL